MSRRAHALALAGALAVFLLLLLALRLRNWLPFVGAALAYLGLLWAWRPAARAPRAEERAEELRAPLPPGVSAGDHRTALDTLAEARDQLARLQPEAPPADRPTIARMAERVAAIRRHHAANPGHTPRTRAFIRHTLPRMVAAVAGYVDLARRTGPGDAGLPDLDERLAEVSRRLAGFVPVLDNIDRACVDDDLTALEINVEVLDEQLGRSHDGRGP